MALFASATGIFRQRVKAWLSPDAKDLESMDATHEDKDQPYAEYLLAA